MIEMKNINKKEVSETQFKNEEKEKQHKNNNNERVELKLFTLDLIKQDFYNAIKYYKSDWVDAYNNIRIVLSAALAIFSTSLMTSIAFGLFYEINTKGEFNLVSSLASGGICGIIQAVLGGNPMTIVGQTGPITIVYKFVYIFSNNLGIEFGPWCAWIAVWACLMHWAVAILGVNRHSLYLITPFTGQIFEMLVAFDFITNGIKELFNEFNNTSDKNLNGFMSLLLAFGFIVLTLVFKSSRSWSFGTHSLGLFFSRFDAFLALLFWVVISYIPQWLGTNQWPADVPERPMPSQWGNPAYNFGIISDMGNISIGAIFGAIVPAFLLTVLFYVDHNISSIASYNPEYGFKKPTKYELDFFVLGFSALVCGLLGLPISSGLIPQNPMHSRLLLKYVKNDEKVIQQEDDKEETTDTKHLDQSIEIVDQRLSPFIHGLLLLICILILPMIGWIPTSLIWGYFLILASEAFSRENQFFCRVLFMFTSKKLLNTKWDFAFLRVVPMRYVTLYTMIQLTSFILVYIIAVVLVLIAPHSTWPVIGSTFPILIMLYAIPLRTHLIPKIFCQEYLVCLDDADPILQDVQISTSELEQEPADEFTHYAGRGDGGKAFYLSNEKLENLVQQAECEMQTRHHEHGHLYRNNSNHSTELHHRNVLKSKSVDLSVGCGGGVGGDVGGRGDEGQKDSLQAMGRRSMS